MRIELGSRKGNISFSALYKVYVCNSNKDLQSEVAFRERVDYFVKSGLDGDGSLVSNFLNSPIIKIPCLHDSEFLI